MTLLPPRSPLFPYTTLFRSSSLDAISAEELRAFSELARRFDRVAGEVWAYKKLRGILTGANAADVARLEGLRDARSEEHTSELQSRPHLVCRLLLEKKK